MQAGPYKSTSDDYLANASSFSLSVVYLCSLMFKMATLTQLQEVIERISPEQRVDYDVPSVGLSILLIASVLGSLFFSLILLVGQLARERAQMAKEARAQKARRLRYKETHKEVEVEPVESDRHFHTFLSHVWGTGMLGG